jgi:Clr5 domain
MRQAHSTEELPKSIQSLFPTVFQGSVRENGGACDRCRSQHLRCIQSYTTYGASYEACDSCAEASAACLQSPRLLDSQHVSDQGVGTGSSQADKSNESMSDLRKAEHLLKVTPSSKDSNNPSTSLPPPLLLNAALPSAPTTEYEHDSTTKFPSLAISVISAAETNLVSPPPSVQKLQSQSASTDAPNATQSLPSLQTALSQTADTPIVKTPNSASLFPRVAGEPAIGGQQNSASPTSTDQEASYFCTSPKCLRSGRPKFKSEVELMRHCIVSHRIEVHQSPSPEIQPRSTPEFIEQHLLERGERQDHRAGSKSETSLDIPTRAGRQYTPEQWAEKKDLITQLYVNEGKSLREVKEWLRERHDFRPTYARSSFLIWTFLLTVIL